MAEEPFENPKPPLCVYCSAPWTPDMMKCWAHADMDWGYYPGEFDFEGIDTVIDVTCSTCKRLVYRKEIRITGNDAWGQ